MAFQSYIMDFDRIWWRESIIYEIYVQSFQDSNDDGIGDLRGIIQRLSYLKRLGVDMVWLTPIYKSPMHDQGYDISDYQDINPIFGSMADWEELLALLHEKDMKLMMDLVVNHTSIKHNWFVESSSSKENPKRDWYFWRPPKYKGGQRRPPNNWQSLFGGSAWAYHEGTGEYYLHLFSPHQPDLNWDNAEVRNAIYGMMKFWLDKGTDGFRMDVINLISKVPGLPDAPVDDPTSDIQLAVKMFINGPNVHKYLREMNDKVLSHYDVCTVGEMPCGVSTFEASRYVAKERRELSMVFQFNHMDLDATGGDKWKIRQWQLHELKEVIARWQQHMIGNHGWNSLYFDNHDQPRALHRLVATHNPCNIPEREAAAKMIATLLFSLRGTVYIYQGQEIGMVHPKGWTIENYQDVETLMFYESELEKRKAAGDPNPDMSDVMHAIHCKGRDNVRVPMHWSKTKNGGFTSSHIKPWLDVDEGNLGINVEDQVNNPHSVLSYYKKITHIRKQFPPLFYGGYIAINEENENIYAFLRTQGPFMNLIILNFVEEPQIWAIPNEIKTDGATLIIGNYLEDGMLETEEHVLEREVYLKPFECRMYNLRP